jgi:hypothetical protein
MTMSGVRGGSQRSSSAARRREDGIGIVKELRRSSWRSLRCRYVSGEGGFVKGEGVQRGSGLKDGGEVGGEGLQGGYRGSRVAERLYERWVGDSRDLRQSHRV